MRNKFIIPLFAFLVSCTNYKETFIKQYTDFDEVKIDEITTELPLVSIKVNPEDFNYIHENFTEDKEINAFISFYRDKKTVKTNILSEIKIKGSASAQLPLKSIGIVFDKKQDNSNEDIISPKQTLDRHNLASIKTIRLRNSGNDFSWTMIKQATYMDLAIQANLNLDLNYIEQSVVFVNDEFHGIMNINSEVNSRGIYKLYDVDRDDIILAKVVDPGHIHLKDGNEERLNNFLEQIKDKNTASLLKNIDQENLIDYLIFQTFTGNMDWPYNNVRFYCVNDGKWRFSVFDLDRVNTLYLHKSRSGFIESTTDNLLTELFQLVLKDETFRNKYEERYKNLMNSSVFSPAIFNKIVDEKSKNIKDIMPFQIQKYGSPKTMTEWYSQLEQLKSNYNDRHNYLSKDLTR